MMKKIISLILLMNSFYLLAQNNVGIGTAAPNSQAVLDISSSDKGVLISRLTTVARTALGTALTNVEDGMLVYDKDLSRFFYWNGINLLWNQVGTSNGDNWGSDAVKTTGTNLSGDGTTASPLLVTEADGVIGNEYNTGATLSGTTLSITDGGGSQDVDLSTLQDGVNDADADPTNEYITGANLTGNDLNIIDNGSTTTVNLSVLKDHDWYKVGGMSQPDNINDNIFTEGTVGVATTMPTAQVDINGDLRVRNIPAGTDTDEILVVDASGNLRKISLKLTDTWQAVGTTDASTITKSWVDIPEMLLNTTLVKEADVLINWDATIFTGPSGTPWGAYRILLDGIVVNNGHLHASASHDNTVSLSYIAQNLSAGNHTIKVQWAIGSTGSGDYLRNPALNTTYLGGSKIWSRQLRAIAYYY